jgi:anti-sigma B factor antagonist
MSAEVSYLRDAVKDGVHVVEFSEQKIFEQAAQSIQSQLTSLITAEGSVRLLISFRNVEHISSAALGMLINIQKSIRLKRGKMILSDLHPRIFEVFKITTLDRMFEIYEFAEDAMTHF